jgi:hypothetical protein
MKHPPEIDFCANVIVLETSTQKVMPPFIGSQVLPAPLVLEGMRACSVSFKTAGKRQGMAELKK